MTFSAKTRVVWNWLSLIIVFLVNPGQSQPRDNHIIIDHTCTDLSQIPDNIINKVKDEIKIFHASTSHGLQIIEGLVRLGDENSKYKMSWDWSLPNEENTLCILHQSWYEPELFFKNVGTYLDDNPQINVAMYVWCGQASWYNINTYILSMDSLEQAYPHVTFIYFTGHAQEADCAGDNRFQFNEALRKYCNENKRILYDFADLDVWYNNEKHTYISPGWCENGGETIPLEHPQYNGDDAGHTTYESCENKGKAFWWTLASITSWDTSITAISDSFTPPLSLSIKTYPNPYNESTTIVYNVLNHTQVNLSIYDSLGKHVVTLVDWKRYIGRKDVIWKGLDKNGSIVSNGIYFVSLSDKTSQITRKILFVR